MSTSAAFISRRGKPLGAIRPSQIGHLEALRGVRYDSFGVREILDQYYPEDRVDPDLTDIIQAPGEFGYAERSGAWRVGSFQAEMANRLPDLVSRLRDISEFGASVDAYGFWDLDESIRFAIARHFSLFNLKGGEIPFTDHALASPRQKPALAFCDCSEDGTERCVADAVERLLTSTGAGVRLASRLIRITPATAGQTYTLKHWWVNLGNSPTYSRYELRFAFVPRDAFDPADTSITWEVEPAFPRPMRGPVGATTLASLFTPVSVGGISMITQADPDFDVRRVEPVDDRNPESTAIYGSAAANCDEWSDSGEAFGPNNGRQVTIPSGGFPYEEPAPPVPPQLIHTFCQFLSFSSASCPPWFGALPVTTETTSIVAPPKIGGQPTDYVILFQLRDRSAVDILSDSRTDKTENEGVPLDLRHERVIGDASAPRWYFYSYITVQ